MESRRLRLEESQSLCEVTGHDLSAKEAHLIYLRQPGSKYLDRYCLGSHFCPLSAEVLREGSAKGSWLGSSQLLDFTNLTFLIGFQMSIEVRNVFFSLTMDLLDSVEEVGGNFI